MALSGLPQAELAPTDFLSFLRPQGDKFVAWLSWVVLSWLVLPCTAQEKLPQPELLPPVLTVDQAIAWALQNNPDLAFQRQQHGIAAADIVIARTYPFNPVLENRIQNATGPESAGITNRVPLEHILLWEVELHGQGTHRRSRANAGLARTDWEIAYQEHLLSVRVLRAFNTLLYQQQKIRLVEETVRFNEQLVGNVRELLRAGKLRGADLIIAQTEVDDARSFIGPGRTLLIQARYDLAQALGAVDSQFKIQGLLPIDIPRWDFQSLTETGLLLRSDLHAREAAVTEAQARLRLFVSDRYGNPTIGPIYTLDPTRVSSVGAQVNIPLPFFNTHRGEITQRQAEVSQAFLDLRRTDILMRQQIGAALARSRTAQNRVELYRKQLLPNLQQSLEGIMRLFAAGEPSVDVLRVIDVRRKLLHARDGYIDALGELSQAQADLAAAVGDAALAIDPNWAPQPSTAHPAN